MQAIAIPPDAQDTFAEQLDRMHRLRARVFSERLNWDVAVESGREADAFDDLRPIYILAVTDREEVAGCARLLPATGPTLLSILFPELVTSGLFKPHAAMIESSRFCADTSIEEGRGREVLHEATWTLFSAIIEWCLVNGYSELVTVTDVRIERILRRAGWPMTRIGEAKQIGNTRAVVGLLPADEASFARVRPAGYKSSMQLLRQAA